MSREVGMQGTVKEFRWGAPHSSVILVAKLPGGKTQQMSLVTGPPDVFARAGFTPKSLHPGDKVRVTYHPNVNGSPGGALATMTLPDGRVFKDQESFGAQR